MLNKEVTLLSKNEVTSKAKILQEIDTSNGEYYWTSTPPYCWLFSDVNHFLVASAGDIVGDYNIRRSYGVRPVLKYDNSKLLDINFSSLDCSVIEYGQFPHLLEEIKIPNTSYLRQTGKKYSLPRQEESLTRFVLSDYPEYDYYGKKVIQIGEKYYPVKPIRFYVDRDNSMLISTDVLFNSPMDLTRYFNDVFKDSQLYKYLNREFIKSLNPAFQTITSYNENSIPDMMPQSVEEEDIDETKKSLIKRIDKLLKRNAELQAISKAVANELKELRTDIKGKKYVRK